MSKSSELIQVAATQPPANIYGYPDAAKVVRHQNDEGEVHFIWGAATDPTSGYANAPNGSIYHVLGASGQVWVKLGATFGAKDGTWTAMGVSAAATAATATSDGLTTGLLAAQAQFVTVTSANANNIVELPSIADMAVGSIIRGRVAATGFELRLSTADRTATTVLLNEVGGATEGAIPADTSFMVIKISATQYILTCVSKLGAVVTPVVPDAV